MVTAHNPILKGFYPDPSICRVGDDFYLANSSFVYAPGVPIFHSRDLAHWEQIGNILCTEEQNRVSGEISRGIFAPTIRYNNGTYYMVTTNVSYGGNFIVTAKNPQGPWSEPFYLGEEAAPGIDPSLFFDDDGKCYYVGTRPNPQGEQYSGDWEIWVQEIDLTKMKLVGESMAIWKGALKDVIWPEGPHLYKKDGYYYLLHAEGGTGPEHAISVARSRELFSWFEGCPRNPIFTHRNLGKDYPVINTGHGDLVDDKNGNWYIVMLASRQCKNRCSLGRETFLAKVTWEDGWPVINPGVGKLEDDVEIALEPVRYDEEYGISDTLTFDGGDLDHRLVGIARRTAFSLNERKGYLRMYTGPEKLEEIGGPAYLGLRQKSYDFRADCGIEFEPVNEHEAAGLSLFQNHENHLNAEVIKKGDVRAVVLRQWIKGSLQQAQEVEISATGIVEIVMEAHNQLASVAVKNDGKNSLLAEDVSLLPYTTEEAGGFVGCTAGIYTSSNGHTTDNYCDVKWLNMLGLD